MASGMNMATAAVLLINPDIIETVRRKMKIVNHLWLPPFLARKSAKTSRKPVFTRARLKINMAPMVITAGLLNPLMASCQLRISNKSNIPMAPMAVTSMGRTSSMKNTTITRSTAMRINISKVIFIISKNCLNRRKDKVRHFPFLKDLFLY